VKNKSVIKEVRGGFFQVTPDWELFGRGANYTLGYTLNFRKKTTILQLNSWVIIK